MKTATSRTLLVASVLCVMLVRATCSSLKNQKSSSSEAAAEDDGKGPLGDAGVLPEPTAPSPAPTTLPSPEETEAPSPAPYVDPDDAGPDAPDKLNYVYPTGCEVVLPGDAWPTRLSETQCYADQSTQRFAPGAIIYDVRVPFYSGGAEKRRALFLPQGEKITYSDEQWALPQGTRIVKTFLLEGQPIETRILRLTASGKLEGASYKWNAEGSDATLLTDGMRETIKGISWYFPKRDQCNECHTEAAGLFLGLETRQMNKRHDAFGSGVAWNQIDALRAASLLIHETEDEPVPPAKALPRLSDPSAKALPLMARARSYLHANCAYCHRPGSTGNADIDVRISVPFRDAKSCGADDKQGDMGVKDAKIIIPGAAGKSIMWLRMVTDFADARMPQHSSGIADPLGSSLLKEWIDALIDCQSEGE